MTPNNLDPTGKKRFGILLFLTVFLLLPFLGLTLFNTKGEPREAIVALSMLNSDNWILPVNNGGEMAYKPPFFHWLIALFSSVLNHGQINEYLSRLPSALSLIAMIAAGYWFYGKRKGYTLALVAGLLTLTNFEVHRAGVNCRVDMLLTACMVGALYLLYLGHEKRKTAYYLLALLCMSGAMLTKGPVGILLPCMVGFAYELCQKEHFARVLLRYIALGLGALVIPMMWYVAAYQEGGQKFFDLVWEENVLRFTGKMSYGSHENPPIYNVMTILTGMLPYTLLVLIGLVSIHLRHARNTLSKTWWKEQWHRLKAMDSLRLFTLLSFVIIFVFYCIPKSKRSVYLLPVYPFMCYFLAEYMHYLWQEKHHIIRLFGRLLATLVIIVSVTAIILHFIPIPEIFMQGHNAQIIGALHDIPWTFWNVAGILLPLYLGIHYWFSSFKPKNNWIFYGTLILPYSILFALDCHYQPTLLNERSDKLVVEQIKKRFPEGDIHTYIYMPDFNIASKMHYFTLNFYLNDRVKQYEQQLPAEGYVIMGEYDYREHFCPAFGQEYNIREVENLRHKSCDTKQTLAIYYFQRKKTDSVSKQNEKKS